MENRAFNEMLKAARAWLAGRDPEEIARKCGVHFDATARLFALKTLGKEISIRYPDYEIMPELDYWHQLVILHYLHHGDGFPILDKAVSFAQLKDGMIRGGGFDSDCAAKLSAIIGQRNEAQLTDMFLSLGGRIIPSKADICARFDFLPRYPLTLSVYLADDEFPAEGRLMVDASADHYLSVEDAVTVGMVLLGALEELV